MMLLYHDAILSYDKALTLNPNDVDSKHNKVNALEIIACMAALRPTPPWVGIKE
ncbi:MAG: hypothetical protein WA323_27455 [Candidatus Nitrosopolaris sp.]|jgi:hypothetical protein